MRAILIAAAVAAAGWHVPASAAQGTDACQNMLAAAVPAAGSAPVTPMDLLRLRDIGYMHMGPGQRLLAVSPDRSKLAFVMHRADPNSDRYCVGLVLLDLISGRPRLMDSGDALIMAKVAIRGVEVDYGLPRTLVPQWSADGKRLAWLRQIEGVSQIVEINPVDGSLRQVTHSDVGVDHFAWGHDAESLVYSDQPAREAAASAIAAEGQNGYLVDDRIVPYAGTTPAISSPLPTIIHSLNHGVLSDKVTREDIDRLAVARLASGEQPVSPRSWPGSWTLEKTQLSVGSYSSPTGLAATDQSGRRMTCDHADCRGSLFLDIEGAWGTDRPGEFTYIRREGWAGSQYGLYLWRPGRTPRPLFRTDDLVIGCESLGSKLICARETALRPRHLVLIDLRQSGKVTDLFDPNPDYRALSKAKVERLYWRNARGQESFADLVLPTAAKHSTKLPLVIVQYNSRGFLRGGTGDEYPIQPLVQNGFAVLSFQKPGPLFAVEGNDGKMDSLSVRLNQDWEDRRNIHSSLMAGLDILRQRSDIDMERIGISGVSDGSTTVQYGLINSPGLFKAASMGSCCVDPTSMMIYAGSGVARERKAWGFPPAYGPGSERWKPLALSQNAQALMAPLLMQLADHEFIIAMETLSAYQDAGRPVEARIFPDEHHLKSGPRHRLAVYCRNIRWFGFWLDQPVAPESCPPAPEENRRWAAMKTHNEK
ncbi:Dipeptidyl aminopeptidase/acylaminoacyl peptidase [Sphingobium sp. AP50]|uniref:Atxe2 family lasso peptide isopeptidase n=1 Tax=Sphingobium sp. AP50 TaxID=1884369 RepID=UPI0008C7191C|nr:Atxe2 family lasso peptide isopeptidase [Sphingobium sp. AP50]SEK05540.1 Dipeptidyl aminopeptidase/acylaminoacyl peptidase [Sphingobium sp. AP50]